MTWITIFKEFVTIITRLIKLKSPDDIYYSLITEWNDDDKLFDQINIEDNISFKKINELNIIENMMYFDSISYLTDDILYKVDRSSMNHGLECRAPFLDEDVITKAWQIPFTRKINNTKNGKLILQKILSKYIPNRLFDRPKMGFGIPLESWIKGDLKDFVYNSILSSDFKNFDLIDNKIVKNFFDEHMSNKRNWEHRLWSLVVLSNWLKKRKFI